MRSHEILNCGTAESVDIKFLTTDLLLCELVIKLEAYRTILNQTPAALFPMLK